ncbi:DUF5626 family protein [Rummeliibacillus sp. SL167]|uniref:DUF5626 family protein n=1 Tax=Rummeliibacillus sp. SL167 TaxID=2579792 RepID=UPI0011B82CA5|nr:DUF5626 family protein [Rummeliibacillus sp. SL167]
MQNVSLKNKYAFLVGSVLVLLCLFTFIKTDKAFAAESNNVNTSDLSATFDLEKNQKQETQMDLPNGEKATVGIEPATTISLFATYPVDPGTQTWRVYYDAGTLASEFYATIYVPKSGYSKIKSVYGERPIRIIGGSVSSETLKLVRSTETSSQAAYAYYKIVTTWINGWGSSSPTLHLKVAGNKVTTEAEGFFW